MIILRFIRSSSLVGKQICAATWSEYSHVDFFIPGEGFLGAQSDGVKIRPLDYCKPAKELYCAVAVSPATHDRVMAFAMAQIGKPYDYGAILGILAHRDWEDDKRWFCSELVAAAFKDAGYSLLKTDHVNRVTPGMLLLSPFLRRCPNPPGILYLAQ